MKRRLSNTGVSGLLLIAAAALLLAAGAAAPFLWNIGAAGALADAQAELAFLEAKLKTAGVAKPRGFTAADDISPVFIEGATPGLALAGLQRRMERLAAENGMALIRSQPTGDGATAGLASLRMEIEAAGSLENLRGLLHSIEMGEPFIFITTARIEAARSEDGALPADKLTASLQLEALGWREAAP